MRGLFDLGLPAAEIVPWLSPYVVAECRGLWASMIPEKLADIERLASTRREHKYRGLRIC
jgi:hypothetical protein